VAYVSIVAGTRGRNQQAAADVEWDLGALTFHPPTLDMLDRIGATPWLPEQGLACPTWQIRWHPQARAASTN
jgi:hypothetical protein